MASMSPFLYLIVVCTYSWTYYAFICQLCLSQFEYSSMQVACIVVYHIILVLSVWSYFQTTCTVSPDPPPKFKFSQEMFNAMECYTPDSKCAKAILKEFANDLPVMMVSNTHNIRYCEKCKIVQPDRAHHCNVCKRCVLQMSHHCYWINNCVSHSNKKFYILLLFYESLKNIYVSITVAIFYREKQEISNEMLGLLFISLYLILFCGSLLVRQLYYVLKNLTCIEYKRPPIFKKDIGENGYDLGWSRNLQEFFGENVFLWLFPISTSLGDGTHYPLNQRFTTLSHSRTP